MQILDSTGATWGQWLWPIWLGVSAGVFLAFEIYALVSNSANTLSAWVWLTLHFFFGRFH